MRTRLSASLPLSGYGRVARNLGGTKVAYHDGPVSVVDGGFHVGIPAALACSFHRGAFTPIARSQSGNNISPTPRIRV
jgi:hypothetical protein